MVSQKHDFKAIHIDDNKKTRDFPDSNVTDVQFHLKSFNI